MRPHSVKSAGFALCTVPSPDPDQNFIDTLININIALTTATMAPKLTEDEIDDLIYFARAGEDTDLEATLNELAEREKATPAEILTAAKDESNKSTTLHMAAGNGHLGTFSPWEPEKILG